MTTTNNQPKIISKKELSAEIESRSETLGLKRGPKCNGCFDLVLTTVCGHAYVVRERCKPKGLVCAGSKLLTVHWDDVTLALGEAKCQYCRKIHKYLDGHSESLRKLYAQKFTPKKIAAKTRMEAVKEQWQRECVEQDVPVTGLTRAQLDALAAEKAAENKDSNASPSSPENDTSKWVLPDFCDFVGDHPRMLHDPNLENEWKDRGKFLLQKVGSVSRAEHDAEAPQSPVDDPSPAFTFRSPYLSKAPTDQTQVHSENHISY